MLRLDQVTRRRSTLVAASRSPYNGNSTIESVTDNAAIDITGGSLTVTSGASTVSGAFSVAAGASLSASGAGTTFTATGSTTIDGANLFASSGASLSVAGCHELFGIKRRHHPGQRHRQFGRFVASDVAFRRIRLRNAQHQRSKRRLGQPQECHEPSRADEVYANAQGASSVIDFSKLPSFSRTHSMTLGSRPAVAARFFREPYHPESRRSSAR